MSISTPPQTAENASTVTTRETTNSFDEICFDETCHGRKATRRTQSMLLFSSMLEQMLPN